MQPPSKTGRSYWAIWLWASSLGFLSLLLFPIGINLAGSLLFSGPTYERLEGAFFFFSIFVAPLGLFYWICWGVVATLTKIWRSSGPADGWVRLNVALFFGLIGFLGLILTATFVVRLLHD